MLKTKLHCSLIAPEAKVFEEDVDFVALPAHDGEIGILLNHSPLVCQLGAGQMRIRTGAAEQVWFIDAGFAQVVDNRVTVLTQKALKPDEIDRAQANQQLQDARLMPTTDEDAARRRIRAETSARAKLHMAR